MTSIVLRTEGHDIIVEVVPFSFLEPVQLIRTHGALDHVTVDHAAHDIELRTLEALPESPRFAYAERQMLEWTQRVLCLRPGQELASVSAPLTEAIEQLRETRAAWDPAPAHARFVTTKDLLDAVDAVLARSK